MPQIDQVLGLFLLAGMWIGVFLSVRLGGRRVSLILELPSALPAAGRALSGARSSDLNGRAAASAFSWIRPFLGGFLLLFGAGWTARVASGPLLTGISQLSGTGIFSGQTILSALLFLGTAFSSAILINRRQQRNEHRYQNGRNQQNERNQQVEADEDERKAGNVQ
jgi:hypothetical protein